MRADVACSTPAARPLGINAPAHLPAASQEEDGGMEEPPEINEFIRELGGALGQEAGAAPGSGLSMPRCAPEQPGGCPARHVAAR